MAYFQMYRQQKKTIPLKHAEFDLINSHCAVNLLDTLIEMHKDKMNQNEWAKMFVIDNTTNKFSISGPLVQIEGLHDIVKSVSNLMLQYGLATEFLTYKDVAVEFHYANFEPDYLNINLKNNKLSQNPYFGIHNDNEGVVNYKAHTFIIYKTIDLEGGNFAFFDDMCGNEISDPTIINIQNVPDGYTKAIMFDGDLYHNAMRIVSGTRFALSFQISEYGCERDNEDCS